ncbi:MAG: alkaline shock response membrane anchor protein AmaP [Desulfitobacteriaceae bacterium]
MLGYAFGALLVLIAVWAFAIATGWVWPYAVLVGGLDWVKYNTWESAAVALLLLLLGLLLFFRPRQAPALVFNTISKHGEVRVTQEAVQEIISQGAQNVQGIRSVSANLKPREDGLEITVISQLNPEVVIPATAEELQLRVKEDVEHYTGIRVAEVKVLVRSLENMRPARVK